MGFDILALSVLFIYMLVGLVHGVIKTSLNFAFLVLALFLAGYANSFLVLQMSIIPIIKKIVILQNPAIMYMVSLLIITSLANLLRPICNRFINRLHLGFTDYLFGCLVGLVEGVVFLVIITACFYYVKWPDFVPIDKMIDNSFSYAYFVSLCDQIVIGWNDWIKHVR